MRSEADGGYENEREGGGAFKRPPRMFVVVRFSEATELKARLIFFGVLICL